MQADIAIIGGTGVYDPELLIDTKEELLNTKYGCVNVIHGSYANKKVAFIARHGKEHHTPPHKVNYRANIEAIHKINAKKILATAAVGSLRLDYRPGDFVILDQFVDFTKRRNYTFFDGDDGVAHIDLTNPYCPKLRDRLIQASQQLNLNFHKRGTYICTEGPRFETPAEISLYANWNCDVVGMTNVPEVILAREKELCYATVAMVTNYGAGISQHPLTHKEVSEVMANNIKGIRELFFYMIENEDLIRDCNCQYAAAELGKF
ncbi:methylthioadenosine phosphorylase [Desulfuribacillus stibiiarsenatis]|uniref:Purine nucleoside phosphorylase n=1 Tax=Desulfuribacillus stibiiarsenatis TaxID=1390249 RepID=A0A1E5L420_9FIRM|nr:methylthioadenosine phosphorylase [Desulfuribacillus stibiiarsenatis]